MTNKSLSLPSEINENVNVITETVNNTRRPRTSEDFYEFCTTVLKYENYEALQKEDLRNETNQSPPLDSSGSSVNSESTSSGPKEKSEDEDSDIITCFCGKPFAGRAMIECLECLTWIHFSCAKIKKTNIPEVFICAMCKKKQKNSSSNSPPDKSVKRPRKAM